MEIFRTFDWDGRSSSAIPGGPLYVPRHKQRNGRHDIPHKDGVIYCSSDQISAIAEAIKPFRGGEKLENSDFVRPDQSVISVVRFECEDAIHLVDLGKPGQLARFQINPADVLSYDRRITQMHSEKIFDADADGFVWWSALNPKWRNLTLFESRALKLIKMGGDIRPLRIDLPELKEAALQIGVIV